MPRVSRVDEGAPIDLASCLEIRRRLDEDDELGERALELFASLSVSKAVKSFPPLVRVSMPGPGSDWLRKRFDAMRKDGEVDG